MNLRRILLYLKLDAKSFMRGKTGPFFLIVFPIILILLFGSILAAIGLYVALGFSPGWALALGYWTGRKLWVLTQGHSPGL